MPIPEELNILLNEESIECSHDFEIDLTCLVTANHKIVMEGIARQEEVEFAAAQESVKDETDFDAINSILYAQQNFYEDLRVAAVNLAVVGLVTRLQHWAARYAKRLDVKRKIGSLDVDLNFLNARLGKPPVETEYFFKLAEVRHSIIHADSLASWIYKGVTRSVDPRYAPNGLNVRVNNDDLEEAIEKAVVQIKWYDEKLRALNK